MPAKKTTSGKQTAKKPAAKPAAKKSTKPTTRKSTKDSTAKTEDQKMLERLELSGEDKALIEKIKLIVKTKTDELVGDALATLNSVIVKTHVLNVDGEVMIDMNTGQPVENWENITLQDMTMVLMKIPVIQFNLTRLETDAWVEEEVAKQLRKDKFEYSYEKQSSGSEAQKKNKATISAREEAWTALYLEYAHRIISDVNASLSKITAQWSRAIELK